MSRSRKNRKPKRLQDRWFPPDGWDCPYCNPDIKLEWFRRARTAQEKSETEERVSNLE